MPCKYLNCGTNPRNSPNPHSPKNLRAKKRTQTLFAPPFLVASLAPMQPIADNEPYGHRV